MGLPGHRRTSSHKRRRAAHFALKKLVLAACPKCKEPMMPHRACPSCGTYAGRKVRELASPLAKHKHEHKHDHKEHKHEEKAG
jgi:large subunit ribosomal protein L32